jgi:hypothetical protein
MPDWVKFHGSEVAIIILAIAMGVITLIVKLIVGF